MVMDKDKILNYVAFLLNVQGKLRHLTLFFKIGFGMGLEW